MIGSRTSTTSYIAFFILSVFFLVQFAGNAFAVPILSETSKKPVSSAKQTVSSTRHTVSKTKHTASSTKHSKAVHTKTLSETGKRTAHSNSKQTPKSPKSYAALPASQQNLWKRLSARSAIIIDSESGRTIFSKNPDAPRQPASTIKILTGSIAINTLKNQETVPVSTKAAGQPASKFYLDHRKKYLADDLIDAVLLTSANDASVALAEKIAGTESSFAQMMNLRAKMWGATHTICKTATGLTAKGQSSTARDLATMFNHAMKNPEFAARMQKHQEVTSGGKKLLNHNKALWQVKGAVGGKTGYTYAARQTYVGKFKRGSNEIVVAIMGSEQMWNDLKTLVNYGFKQEEIAKTSQQRDKKTLSVATAQ